MSGWTLEQATELCLTQMLVLLDGCDDEDAVRPGLVFEAVRQAWAPQVECEPLDCTAGELRERTRRALQALTEGEMIP